MSGIEMVSMLRLWRPMLDSKVPVIYGTLWRYLKDLFNDAPKVRNVNKGKRRKKKHHYKIGDHIAIKWIGEKQIGVISELQTTKDGYAYKVRLLLVSVVVIMGWSWMTPRPILLCIINFNEEFVRWRD